jgi:hypothetical protein
VLATEEQKSLKSLNSTMVEVHSIAATIAIIMWGNLKILPMALIIIDRATADITAAVTIGIEFTVLDCNCHRVVVVTVIVIKRKEH